LSITNSCKWSNYRTLQKCFTSTRCWCWRTTRCWCWRTTRCWFR